jgi:microcystin-dependent protein
MAVSVKHDFISPKTDGTDVTLVKPSNWNAEHTFIMDEGILGRPPGSGPGEPVEIPIGSLFMSGMITMWAGTTAPTGWLLCDGAAVSRTTYAALFTVIGVYYGAGDGVATFNVPDMRGRVAAGVDPGTGRLTTATINNPALPGGVGGQQTEQAYADVSTAGRSYGYTDSALSVHVYAYTQDANLQQYGLQYGGSGYFTGSHQHLADWWFNTEGQAHLYADGTYTGGGYTRVVTNVQPTLTVNYIIKV